MNERITRTSSSAAIDGDATDWERLRGLTDDEIAAAVAEDPDAWLTEDDEAPLVRGVIFRDRSGGWRWRLIAADGGPIADSPRSYHDRSEVERAIHGLRTLIAEDQARRQAA